MFQHSHRGTMVWLVIVGVALALTLIAGEVTNAVGALMLAGYLGLVLAVTRNAQIASMIGSLSAKGARQSQPTEVAREAAGRARSHPTYDPLIRLIDVGLIVDEQRPDGMSLRRGRFVSLDEDGVRPFAIVHVPDALSERVARIRFEIRDETGRAHYVHESEKWLRAGETPLLPDYRFPIRKNAAALEAGGWTVHVMIDGGLLGIHHFNLSPSLRDRRRQTESDGEIRERVWRTEEEDESLPLSLEELLRQQSRQHRQPEV